MMVTAVPAIVAVPLRAELVAFAATCTVTVPDPDPDCPDEIVIQAAPDEAVQAHDGAEVTANVAGPPAAVSVAVVGATE